MPTNSSLHTTGWRRALLACALLAIPAALPGCGSNTEQKVALAKLSSTCHINSDCASPLVCVFQHCHQACETSRDCEHGERCVQSATSRNVCQLPDEQGCSATGYCPGNEVCGVDAQCRDGCASNDECVTGQVCTSGTCADHEELGDSGALTPSPERPTNTPPPCAFDSDCAEQQRCMERVCRVECSLNSDCAQNETCENARCTAVPSIPGCRYHSDCGKDELCDAGTCTQRVPLPEPACQVDQDCSSAGQHCQRGQCACECETSGDCARGQSCDAECACVADRVIYGDVSVQNDAELAELENVVEITGNLQVALPGSTTTLHVPNLRRVKNVHCYRTSINDSHLVFDALEEATSSFGVGFLVEAPHLKRTSSFSVASQVADSIEYPELEAAGYMMLSNLSRATRASFPKLTNLTSLHMGNNPQLKELNVPLLATLSGLDLLSDTFIGDFALPHTQLTGNVMVQSCHGLTSVSLPGLVEGADLSFMSSPLLRSISMPALKTAGRIALEDLPQLQTLELGSLESVSGDFSVRQKIGPISLALPKATTISAVEVLYATGLTGLDLPELTYTDRFAVNTSNLQAIQLPKLTGVGNFYLDNNPKLTQLGLPALSSASMVYVATSEKLTDIDLRSLASVTGSLDIRATGIKDVATIDPALNGKLTQAGGVIFIANPDLPSCLVTALETHLKGPPYNWIGTVENQENCSCAGACP